MPVSKRFLADAQLYAPPDIYEESSPENVLRDISSAGNLGALHQISFLSLYAFEMFDNLSRLAEDVGVRIINATERSSRLADKLQSLESRIQKCDVKSPTAPTTENEMVRKKKQAMKFLKVRSAQHIPSALNKHTNCAQLNGLYGSCNLPPQFWKLEAVIFDDCLIRYSNPGLFFEEWLKVELLKQEQNRLERKRLKKERKLAKKKRREEEEALALEQGLLNPSQVRKKGLKDQKRKKKAEKKEKLKEEFPSSIHTENRTHNPPPSTTASTLFSTANNNFVGSLTKRPTPHHGKPPPSRVPSPANNKLTKPPPSKPPPNKPPPHKPPPNKPPPSSARHNKPPPNKPPPTRKINNSSKPPASKPVTSKTLPSKLPSKSPPPRKSVPSKAGTKFGAAPKVQKKTDGGDDMPPPDDIRDDEPPPDDDSSDELPPPEDDDDKSPPEVTDNDPPPEDNFDDEPPPDDMDDPPPDDDDDIIQEDMEFDGPPDDDLPPDDDIPDDNEEIIEQEDIVDINEVPPETEKIVDEVIDEEDEEEDEDAFDELPPPIVPVVNQPTFQPPKRKQSILMMGKDRKKMAEEASANLQRLNRLSSIVDDESELDNVIDKFTSVEDHENNVPPASSNFPDSDVGNSQAVVTSKSDSVRRKSFLNSGLNIGLDLDVSPDQKDMEHVVSESEDYHETEYEQWEVGVDNYDDEGSAHDQSQAQSQYYEDDNYDNDEYYQDGYFWNGTEWVVADEAQQYTQSEEDYYQETAEETPQQSSLAMFGGDDMLASIRLGSTLKKVSVKPKEVSARDGMLSLIKQGGTTLKKADLSKPLGKKPNEKPDQSDAIARLLSNRAQIAGSDSDSDSDSESDSDDSYF